MTYWGCNPLTNTLDIPVGKTSPQVPDSLPLQQLASSKESTSSPQVVKRSSNVKKDGDSGGLECVFFLLNIFLKHFETLDLLDEMIGMVVNVHLSCFLSLKQMTCC